MTDDEIRELIEAAKREAYLDARAIVRAERSLDAVFETLTLRAQGCGIPGVRMPELYTGPRLVRRGGMVGSGGASA